MTYILKHLETGMVVSLIIPLANYSHRLTYLHNKAVVLQTPCMVGSSVVVVKETLSCKPTNSILRILFSYVCDPIFYS